MTNILIRDLHSNHEFSELNISKQVRVMGGQVNAPGIGDIGGLRAIAESPEAVALLKVLLATGHKDIAVAWVQNSLKYRDVVIQTGIADGQGNVGFNIAEI